MDRFFGRFSCTNGRENRGCLTVEGENHIGGQFDINIYLFDEIVILDTLFEMGAEFIDPDFSTGTESEFPLLIV